jgi:hypothetical protein
VDHPARAGALVELREVLRRRPVRPLGLLLGVEVVQVAVELVEPVHGGEELVLVTEVVLAELPGHVPERLEQLRDRRVLRVQPQVRPGHADLAEPGAEHALPGDERRPARRAALLTVGVGEPHALGRDPVDVRRAVPHQPVAVAAEVGDPDVVAPDHQDVRLPVRHLSAPVSVAPARRRADEGTRRVCDGDPSSHLTRTG